MSAAFERIVDPGQSIEEITQFARASGFALNHQTIGSRVLTTSCELVDSVGISSIGRGKGLGLQSLASGMFEAFEHYYHKREDKVSKATKLKFDYREIDGLLEACPDFGLILGSKPVPLTCLRYEGMNEKWEPIDFPAILSDPAFDPPHLAERQIIESTRIYRYATNSGTAAGVTANEALLHGLLEIIERDSIGVTFVESILTSRPKPVRRLLQQSLPIQCRNLIREVAEETGGTIALWNITSDIGVPAVLCALTIGDPAQQRFFGSGASLFPEYAVERATLEATQGYHIQTILGVSLQPPLTRNPERMSLYQRCGLSAGYFVPRGGEISEDFSVLPRAEQRIAHQVQEQVNLLVDILAMNGIRSYRRTLYEGSIHVTQVLAPHLERLYLISHGISIAPSGRSQIIKRRLLQ